MKENDDFSKFDALLFNTRENPLYQNGRNLCFIYGDGAIAESIFFVSSTVGSGMDILF